MPLKTSASSQEALVHQGREGFTAAGGSHPPLPDGTQLVAQWVLS
jgi:hypothetical protein